MKNNKGEIERGNNGRGASKEMLTKMKNFRSPGFIILVALELLLAGFAPGCIRKQGRAEAGVKNIILFIGDGMGTAHVQAAISMSKNPLSIESFPFSGFSKTSSFDNYVTDSGAGATALACGIKTRNGMVGMRPDSVAAPSIIEMAHEKGLATGVLSTSSITHATPASFAAHVANRDDHEAIARCFSDGHVDVFMGGGESVFNERSDSIDLTLLLESKGYDVVKDIPGLLNSASSRIAGLLAKEHMVAVSDGRTGVLATMTGKAIETLSRDKDGFFLMVEGSMIDWRSHERDFNNTVLEVLDMDMAIAVATDFAGKEGHTLVVVTADHETGGLVLVGDTSCKGGLKGNFMPSGDHTGVMVPVFSRGPGAEGFSGIHDNTFFFGEFLRLLNLKR